MRLSTWWLGDAMGVLVLSPPLLIWGRTRLSWPPPLPNLSVLMTPRCRRRAEAILLCAALGLSSYLSFGPSTPSPSAHSAIEYLPFPLIIWASMRFGVRGASAASLVLTAGAVWHYSISPLERHQLGADANLLLLQTSIAVIVLTALVIGAVMTERDAVTRALEESRAQTAAGAASRKPRPARGRHRARFQQSADRRPRQREPRAPADALCGGVIRRRFISGRSNTRPNAPPICAARCSPTRDKGRFQSQPLDFSAIVRDTIGVLSRSIGGNITMTSDLPAYLPAVDADATQLRQVVMNLLLNASEAIKGDAGTIRVTTGMTIADRALPRHARISHPSSTRAATCR